MLQLTPEPKMEEWITKIENNCLIMIGSHIAHDCLISSNVVLVNNSTLEDMSKLQKMQLLVAIQQFTNL